MKTTSFRLMLAVLGVLLSLNISAYDYDFEMDGFYYKVVSLSDLTCELTKGEKVYSGIISIPSYVTYKNRNFTIIGIAASTFKDNTKISSVTFPETLQYISKEAFCYVYNRNENLQIGDLPQSLETISSDAFNHCTFDNLIFPEKLTTFEGFNNVSVKKTVKLPSHLKTFSGFNNGLSCHEIIIPPSCEVINGKVGVVNKLFIPNNVKSIHRGHFDGNSSLLQCDTLIIEDGDEKLGIGYYNYNGGGNHRKGGDIQNFSYVYLGRNTSLSSLFMGAVSTENTNSPYWAYKQQKNVKTIEIGSQCTEFDLPTDTWYVGDYISQYPPLPALEKIILHNNTPPTLSAYFTNTQYMGDVQILVPKGTKNAYQNANGWKNFWNITEYDESSEPTKSYTLTYIVDGVTYKTYTLKPGETITPETAPSKNGYTFSGWGEMPATMPAKDVTVTGTFIPDNVEDVDVSSIEIGGIYYHLIAKGHVAEVIMGSQKYSGNVTIPASVQNKGITYTVTSIGNNAFWGCKDLTSVTIPSSVTTIGEFAFVDTGLTSMVLPNGVQTIMQYAFQGNSGLTSVTIPGSVTSIGKYTFANCDNLSSVTINNGVTSIGERVFMACGKLKTVVLPNSLEVIGPFSFSGCSQLKSIEIPNSVTTIENGAFVQCEGMESVILPNSLKTLGTYVFQKCYELRSVKIPGSLNTLSEGTFSYCNQLAQVEMEEGIESLGLGAFYNCGSLSSITIPSSVKSLGQMAFQGCTNLNSVTVLSLNPATLTNTTFSNVSKAILCVPKGSINAYKAASYWNGFSLLVEPYYTIIYVVDNEIYKSVDVNYGESVTPEAEPSKEGYTFSGWSEIPVTMPANDITVTGNFTLTDAIGDVIAEDDTLRIFTPGGEPIRILRRGVNILQYKDGTIKKIHVK